MPISLELEQRAINTIRFLAADAVQQANSGHPGLPMGAAAMAYTLWTRHLKHNPKNPKWIDRDRFILSGGHGSMLLYSLLHLSGYGLPLEELKNFRQWGSLTPGHPESHLTVGVETTTGPLGQGFANGVGMAIAEAHLAATFNSEEHKIVDHFIYAIVTDGDLMEGIASEAASLAGHLQLGKLIYLYDDNHISIEGSTDLAFTEDRAVRFNAYGWHTQIISDGNDLEAIDQAIQDAKKDPRPSLILCRTHIGYGAPTRQDTAKAHGEPLGEDELNAAKKNLQWESEAKLFIPEDVLKFFRIALEKGAAQEADWNARFEKLRAEDATRVAELERRFRFELPVDCFAALENFAPDPKGLATRAASGKALNAIANKMPELIGGSADLAPSNNSTITSSKAFQKENHSGRVLHFGVREHAMGAVVNGMLYHGGVRSFGATFLVFSDYMRAAIRLSAISHLPAIWIFTHDSIGVGEDGPTHQPVEHLMSLRLIPNLTVLRPADANETNAAWRIAIENIHAPTALLLTRQNLPTFERLNVSTFEQVSNGAYILVESKKKKPDLILTGSGSEVNLLVDAAKKLAEEKIDARVVSFPSWELFEKQDAAYKESVFSRGVKVLAVEAGVTLGWDKYADDTIGLDHYGASAPGKILFEKFGFTVENVVAKAKALIK